MRLRFLFGALWVVFLTGCSPADEATKHAEMTRAMETLIEVYNTLEMERLDPIMSQDFIRTAPDESTTTLADYKDFLGDFHGLFTDFNMTVDESAVSGDTGFITWSVKGTYIGAGAKEGGSSINITGLARYTFKDGKMTHEFIGFNPGWFREQL